MGDLIFSLTSWPRAILHLDADAFFASCEEAIHPELRGKPIVTGAERGIIACASYAAKARGIQRGIPIHEARRRCPELIVLPSDYETYSLFSRRMFSILRRFTPQVEEYSIDEAFADITGLRRVLNMSYEEIALAVREEIGKELGISVSVGLSLSKVLAKIASKHRKPGGVTFIPGRAIAHFLRDLAVEKVWGIGPATAAYLRKLGVITALDFARLPENIVRKRLTKPGVEIWRELRGEAVLPVIDGEKESYASISKTKTFAPPTNDAEYLFAHLLRNLESACIKARRYNLMAGGLISYLKQQNFEIQAAETKLSRPSSYPPEISPLLREQFHHLYRPDFFYRATGVVLTHLKPDDQTQYSLFEDPLRAERMRLLYHAIDFINGKYGKHTIHLASSHPIEEKGKGKRGKPTCREAMTLNGETKRKHLGLPLLHLKV
ncbi:MAG TPA: DNA polymerase IV [Syntrophales bacterium]|nr:DNA polymerase IV [Syntrophales bacterium]HOL59193.1 DNA polymerase IV [Syntrophales bacterium]HPO35726.1 DNA polymerase IV [Syntrophales bacterium]